MLSEHGHVVMSNLISLLHHHPNDSITEQVEKKGSLMYVPILTVFLLILVVQVMCVLINISSTSAKSRDDVINCNEIIQALASVLVSHCKHTGLAI